MNTITETKKIFLTPTGALICDELLSTLTFNIPGLFSKDKFTLYHTIKVLHCEIPFSWYIINNSNNILKLSTGNIIITIGNYDANSFLLELQSKLPTNMTITFNNSTGIFTLNYNTTFSILPSNCYKIIGCGKNKTYSSTSNKIVLPFMANFLGTKNLYINVPNLLLDNFNSATKTFSTLLCIANNVPPYGVIFYDNRTANKNNIKGVKNDTIDLEILDDDFNPINFNNTEWSITLEIETLKQVIYFNNSTINE
jgi:hypothetical protein